MIDRILLSISPYSEHIVELCQQRALEGHCGRKLLSSFGGPAESGCCGCGDFRWSTSCLVPRTRRFLGDLVGLSWPCDNLPWPLLRREWQLVASCWWTFPACTGTGSLCRSLGCSACPHTCLLVTCTTLTPQRVDFCLPSNCRPSVTWTSQSSSACPLG